MREMNEKVMVCEPFEGFSSISETSIQDFEHMHGICLPVALQRIILETNGGVVNEAFLKFDDKEQDLLVGIEEVFGISNDPELWMRSIVPLTRWVAFKNQVYSWFPTVEEMEDINDDISRYFVFSGNGVVFYLLDYSNSESLERVCYVDLVGGDQKINVLGEDLSSVLNLDGKMADNF